MHLSIMFFAADARSRDPYRLLLEASRYADRHGFAAVWVPERHFHEFGGAYAQPAVVSAALATITERIALRAGSLVSPLHDAVRIAEEWAIVDNLSGGRVGISFGSGWNINDFIFFPERYARRHAIMYEQIEIVRRLWAGGSIVRPNSAGADVEIALYPRPTSPALPLWITSSGNIETFRSAGRIGANVLTHLMTHDLAALRTKIAAYRQARREAGLDAQSGCVTLMLHAFVGTDIEAVRRTVRPHFIEYLRSAVSLEQLAALGGGSISGGHTMDASELEPGLVDELLEIAFERYFSGASLLGTVSSCREVLVDVEAAGVDEVACLLDFGPTTEQVLASLEQVADLVAIAPGAGRAARA
jgi:natural product biosynthesis luciferase-like monooxygenase protein